MNPFKIFIFLIVVLFFVFIFNLKDEINGFANYQPTFVNDTINQPLNGDSSTVIIIDSNYNKKENKLNLIACDNSNSGDIKSYLQLAPGDTCFNSFFNQLNSCNDTLVRIAYYGDSQIEGDHITYTLRSEFQTRFGDGGMGYMPGEMYFNTTKQIAIITNDFEKIILNKSNHKPNNKFGFYGRYFKPLKADCEIRIKNRSKEQIFNQLKIIYSGKVDIEIENNDQKGIKYLLSDSLTIETFNFNDSPENLKLSFSNYKQFKIYGFLLDKPSGIVVDCVPFRGSLNLMMNLTDKDTFREMGTNLNVSLVILHFGLNAIPDQRSNYESFRIALQRDIRLLKELMPQVSILVVGASDMAYKENGEFLSYPNIPKIIEAQRKAALNEHVAFWDLHLAMGGEGAIIKWVEKSWARKDYAHLTQEGTSQIAKIMSRDILKAHHQYEMNND